MGSNRGMGRGLAAILSVSGEPSADDIALRDLPVDMIAPNPRQPRGSFDEAGINALAASVRERGVLQPILVRPAAGGTYELVAGERRWRAARIAGLETVPALVRARDDAEALEAALIENMAREDLNPVEEARACAALVEELGLTREEVGRRIGRSRVGVSNLMRLLDLPDDALGLLEAGELSEGHGRALLLAGDHEARRKLARAAIRDGWSVRTLEERARGANGPRGGGASGGASVRAANGGGANGLHPDQAEAAGRIGDALSAALGREVRVRARGTGYRVEIDLASLEEGLDLAARLRPGVPA